jgi:hypothetical protein
MTPDTERNLKRCIRELQSDIFQLKQQRRMNDSIHQIRIDQKIELCKKCLFDFENLIWNDSKLLEPIDLTE